MIGHSTFNVIGLYYAYCVGRHNIIGHYMLQMDSVRYVARFHILWLNIYIWYMLQAKESNRGGPVSITYKYFYTMLGK